MPPLNKSQISPLSLKLSTLHALSWLGEITITFTLVFAPFAFWKADFHKGRARKQQIIQ
jgi:hypothetical protein